MSIAVFDAPIPCIVYEGDKKIEGYALYVESGGTFEDDCWCIAHENGGIVRHYLSKDIRIHFNGTYGIKNKSDNT